METSFKRDVNQFISLIFSDAKKNKENNNLDPESIPILYGDDAKEDIMLDINRISIKY